MTSTAYSEIVMPVTYTSGGGSYYAGTGVPNGYERPQPCPEPRPYSDEVAPEDALSSVDFDSWTGVHTIQPLRWRAPEAYSSSSLHSLEFRARSDAGSRLRLEISAPVEKLESDFDVALELTPDPGGVSQSSQARLLFNEPDGTSWSSIGGRIRVQPQADGQVRLALADIVLDKSRLVTDPEVTRTVATGSIIGSWIRESSR